MDNKWNERLAYDLASPSGLTWRSGRCKGKTAGCLEKKKEGRYVYRVGFEGRQFQAHRIIWEMHNGPVPNELDIDHINGNSTDNRIENLRPVTRKINCRNQKKPVTNTSGFVGVHLRERRGKKEWYATWVDQAGSHRKRFFSEKLYGDKAKGLAIKERQEQIAKLGGYTERHGT